ncbi:BglG family transcription antiterminator [Vagococcus zengguangii]|uniref:BglG family transcription antiterminator n=1 Tax=Vagococcus zengguangii TaxID=2571750 RepID=UPI00143D79BD|nr:PTS sugar transporter subunit IIA [Vagococcus zengguangii]
MKEYQLIEELGKQDLPISSVILSDKLCVSTRTIRNYVSRINQHFKHNVIVSSSKGYLLKKEFYEEIAFYYSDYAAHNFEQRRKNLIKQFLLATDGLEWDDLLNEYNVSETTLKNDLKSIRLFFLENGLSILHRNRHFAISGDERIIRNLIKDIFIMADYDVTSSFFKNQDLLTDEEISFIYRLVETKLQYYNVMISKFVMSNIILYLVIMIKRLQQAAYLPKKEKIVLSKDKMEYLIAQEIIETLAHRYQFDPREEEITELRTMFVGNITSYQGVKQVNQVVDKEFQKVIEFILEEVNAVYGFDLQAKGFKNKLTMHLHQMIERVREGIVINNPLLSLKNTRDIMLNNLGLLVGKIVQDKLGIKIPEEEMVYISAHFGIYFEEEIEELPVTIGIISPSFSYNHLENKLIRKLEQFYGERIVVNEFVMDYCDINRSLVSDLVISTISYQGVDNQEVVTLSPYFTDVDIQKIEKNILAVKLKRKTEAYQRFTTNFIKEELFQLNMKTTSREDLLESMTKKLVNSQIVSDDYLNDVLEKESLSSSKLGEFAIPHALNRKANQSTISVWYDTQSQGLKWGDEGRVKLVLLLTITKEDQDELNDYLQLLLNILSDPQKVQELLLQESFSYFIDKVNEFIQVEVETQY